MQIKGKKISKWNLQCITVCHPFEMAQFLKKWMCVEVCQRSALGVILRSDAP